MVKSTPEVGVLLSLVQLFKQVAVSANAAPRPKVPINSFLVMDENCFVWLSYINLEDESATQNAVRLFKTFWNKLKPIAQPHF
jgi:hypothetical protein